MELSQKPSSLVGENEKSHIVVLTDEQFPQIEITFGGADKTREPLKIDIEDFISVKGYKARGKKLTAYRVSKIEEIEPLEKEVKVVEDTDDFDPNEDISDNDDFVPVEDDAPLEVFFDVEDTKAKKKSAVTIATEDIDESQMKLFDDKEV